MSELRDEVEAINSIYGDASIQAAGEGTYILRLPDASSLKLRFPADYPSSPPAVIETHSSGGKRGAGARDLVLFREAVEAVYHPGEVCLFDAIEEWRGMSECEEVNRGADKEEGDGDEQRGDGGKEGDDESKEEEEEDEEVQPSWVLSDPVVENKSTFIARVARVESAAQAVAYVEHLLRTEKRVREATHNITAWRVPVGPAGVAQDCDDDGETAAGGRVMRLMQVMGVCGAVVVVTRWYGGVKLGPRRFAVINGVAREGMVRAGLV